MDRFFERLAKVEIAVPGVLAIVGALIAALALPLVAKLGLNSDFEVLMRKDKPSVIDLARIRDRVGRSIRSPVAIESDDVDAMQRFAAAWFLASRSCRRTSCTSSIGTSAPTRTSFGTTGTPSSLR